MIIFYNYLKLNIQNFDFYIYQLHTTKCVLYEILTIQLFW